MTRLILASASPRRRELLAGLGLAFTVRPVDLDESVHPGEQAQAYVRRMAVEKATATGEAGELVLAADTIVVIDGEILGKPADAADARATLGRIAGRVHTVFSGVALRQPDTGDNDSSAQHMAVTVERTEVRIAELSTHEIADYVATGEPLDKAGSYAIQGLGALLVEEIEGNYTNVVGLPLPATARLFRQLAFDLRDFR